jgi:glycosyltransferase involved in cell wall biosynthesis
MPELSVIIPCHNAAAHLPAAVASIRTQGVPVAEIIVVDDGSTDGTAALAKTLGAGVRVLRQTNAGPAAARNAGIRAARGAAIAFLDADDLWAPGWLATALPVLHATPATRMVLGHMQPFHDEAACDEAAGRRVLHGPPFFLFVFGCGVYRRRVFDEVGPIDETMRVSEDTDWFFRAWEGEVPMTRLDRVAVLYRRHPDSLTHALSLQEKGFLRVLKKSLDRRRVAPGRAAAAMPGLGAGFVAEPPAATPAP